MNKSVTIYYTLDIKNTRMLNLCILFVIFTILLYCTNHPPYPHFTDEEIEA